MFKLSFLIVFILAGLYFVVGSEDGSSSGKEASSNAGGTGTKKEEQDTQTSNGSETSDGNENNAQTSEDKKNNEEKKLGDHLPDFIGTDKDKASYLDMLLSVCHKEHKLYKINIEDIKFEKCTFICRNNSATVTNKEERIPAGLVCNSHKEKCPEKGPCPEPPLPSC
uniref:Putative ixodes 8-cys protein n=1 Tax=Ixodes ricinus TaxID=34613 RepID=A0A0K8RL63_IXORI